MSGTESLKSKSPERRAFYDCLRHKRLKRTSQRDLILEVFLQSQAHVSSQELYERVRRVNSKIGHTTVYRTLKLLVECGLAHEVQIGDGYTRFEQGFDYSHHDHLICVKCGDLTEFFSKRLEDIQIEVARKHRFTMINHSLRIWGYCQKCNRSEQK